MNAHTHSSASADPSDDYPVVSRLSALSDREFLQRLAQAFEARGYSVDRDTGSDQVDLILQIADQLWFVQTRYWRSPAVDDAPVTELLEVVTRNEATGGIVVCSGSFSEAARLKVRGTGVRLVNGVELSGLLREDDRPLGVGACPRCGASLVERLADGTNHRFRGCTNYPACRYTQGP